MILIGGINLYLDAAVNIIIQTEFGWLKKGFNDDPEHNTANKVCALSIITTVSFHYFAYFSLIFRSLRIF